MHLILSIFGKRHQHNNSPIRPEMKRAAIGQCYYLHFVSACGVMVRGARGLARSRRGVKARILEHGGVRMKVLVLYDSTYGNTEKIARAIGEAIAGDVRVLRAGEVTPAELASIDLLIAGSPTQGFRPVKSVQHFFESISAGGLKGVNVAAFDTRIPEAGVGKGLRLLMKLGGYAAPRIAKALGKKGGEPAVTPEGFFVAGREGPLQDGELERARRWAKTVSESVARPGA